MLKLANSRMNERATGADHIFDTLQLIGNINVEAFCLGLREYLMSNVRNNDLLRAAGVLLDAGRPASAMVLLDAAYTSEPIQALTQGWKMLEEASRGRNTLFDVEMFHTRLALIRPQANLLSTAKAKDTDKRPDFCYALSIGLPWDTTGYAMRSQNLLESWQGMGADVVAMTRPGFPWGQGETDPPMFDTVKGVVYHRTGGDDFRTPRTVAEFFRDEAELTRKIALLRPKRVVAASNYATAIPALYAARRLGLPFIYEVRGFWELSRAFKEPEYQKSTDCRIAGDLEGAVAAAADLVFALSYAMRDELVQRGVSEERIVLLPNAADPIALRPMSRDRSLAAQHSIPANVPVIGYIGSFTTYEGLEDLLRACAMLAAKGLDFRLLLVGSDPRGENHIAPALGRLAVELGISERVIMPGPVPYEAVAAWYSLIDIAPVPRTNARVTSIVPPLKPLEAMAMAKAVVVSDLPPLTEIIQHNETGLVFKAGGVEALSEALARLAMDVNLRQKLGARARAWIVAERSWTGVAKRGLQAVSETEAR